MKRLIIYDILKFVLFLLVGIGLIITGIISYTQHQEGGELCIIIGVSTLITGCSIFYDIFTSSKKIEKNILKTLDKMKKSDNIYLSEQGGIRVEQKQGFFKEFGELCNKYKVDGIKSCEYSCDGYNEQVRVIYWDGRIVE